MICSRGKGNSLCEIRGIQEGTPLREVEELPETRQMAKGVGVKMSSDVIPKAVRVISACERRVTTSYPLDCSSRQCGEGV